ncbi:ABC transporter ATP-binding protein [Schlesneria sp.]|uniref:ABC transporter ATP-binding protein n=1 Tax=Schlesneria sp. TaxID=2762018 RepID=UPI002EFB6020
MTEQPPNLIQAHDVAMAFSESRLAITGIHCAVQRGEFVSLLGPSGCGKSTLLRLFAGLISPTSGQITVAGLTPEDARRTECRVAFVFQEAHLLPWRSVTENIRLPLELLGVPRAEHAELIQNSLRLIGLTDDDAQKPPRSLSGGMRMRVSLARALVTDPELLLLDEPFAALDDVLRQQLNEDLVEIWMRRRWTGVFVTHNVAEAVFLSQRVFVMSKRPGRIIDEVRIPFDFPRGPELRADRDFARLCGELSQRVREAAR